MASSWAVSTFPEDLTFTYNWTIDDLNKGFERTGGAIDSPTFKIPSLPWTFFLRISKISFKFWLDLDAGVAEYRSPRELKINEIVTPISSYFAAQLCIANPDEREEDLNELKLAWMGLRKVMTNDVQKMFWKSRFVVITQVDCLHAFILRFGVDGLRRLSRPQIERKRWSWNLLVCIKLTIVHLLRQCCSQALATLAFLDEGGAGDQQVER